MSGIRGEALFFKMHAFRICPINTERGLRKALRAPLGLHREPAGSGRHSRGIVTSMPNLYFAKAIIDPAHNEKVTLFHFDKKHALKPELK